jgi:signal transduction histidine kinase
MSTSAKIMLQLSDDDLNTNYLNLIDEEDKEIGNWFFNELLIENQTAFIEIRLTKKDGTSFWNEQNAGIVTDSEGHPKGILVVLRDISRRKADEEQILKFTVDLKESNATKDKLFSIIAHDLKNPFQGMLGLSDILMNQVSSLNLDEIKNCAIYINESAKKGYDLLINLLDWARAQSGIIKITKRPLSLLELINHNINIAYSSAITKNISIEYLEGIDYNIVSDKDILNVILRNLITNAIKFTPLNGDVTISVKADNNYIYISVKDNGIGINEENMEKLFCSNAMHTTLGTNNEGGTGLGLILCKELVTKLGGKLSVESTLGNGATFTFTIPL